MTQEWAQTILETTDLQKLKAAAKEAELKYEQYGRALRTSRDECEQLEVIVEGAAKRYDAAISEYMDAKELVKTAVEALG